MRRGCMRGRWRGREERQRGEGERRPRIGEGEALGESRGNYEERMCEREVERERGDDG